MHIKGKRIIEIKSRAEPEYNAFIDVLTMVKR